MWTWRLALLLVLATFLQLLAGGLVHATGSGLACPDWPTCFGTFMPEMKGGVLYEHSHRLLGTLVGSLTVALAVAIHVNRRGDRRTVHLGWGALGLVVAQGVLGGMTVIFRLPTAVSLSHLAIAKLFFLWTIVLAWRLRLDPQPAPPRWDGRRLVAATAAVVYAQAVLGGLVRHTDSGLSCTDLPLCKGVLWSFGAEVSVQLHMAHRLGAVLVGVMVLTMAATVVLQGSASRGARFLACAGAVLVPLQIGLGLLSVHSALEVVTVTAHLGVGALLLASTFTLWLSGPRLGRIAA